MASVQGLSANGADGRRVQPHGNNLRTIVPCNSLLQGRSHVLSFRADGKRPSLAGALRQALGWVPGP